MAVQHSVISVVHYCMAFFIKDLSVMVGIPPTVNFLKFQHFTLLFSNKILVISGLEFTKYLSELQTGTIGLIKQFDLGLRCLSKPFLASKF